MPARTFAAFFAAALGLTLPVAAQNPHPYPVGWEEMTEARKQEFLDIYNDLQASLDELELTPEEREALSDAEKKSLNQARWEVRRGYQDDLVEAEFEFPPYSEMSAALEVKKANQAGEPEGDSDEDVPNYDVESLVGAIVYDAGAPSNMFGGGQIVGNRFSTHTMVPVLTSGTVTSVQAVVVQGPAFTTMGDSAGFVLLGPQTGMGGAIAIFSTFTNGLTGTTETVSFTGFGANYTGSSFFVLFGDFASSYVPYFGTGSTMGQGHHGVVGYTGGMGPNITGTFNLGGTRNAFVRASGNIRSEVPVELMKFEIESGDKSKSKSE